MTETQILGYRGGLLPNDPPITHQLFDNRTGFSLTRYSLLSRAGGNWSLAEGGATGAWVALRLFLVLLDAIAVRLTDRSQLLQLFSINKAV